MGDQGTEEEAVGVVAQEQLQVRGRKGCGRQAGLWGWDGPSAPVCLCPLLAATAPLSLRGPCHMLQPSRCRAQQRMRGLFKGAGTCWLGRSTHLSLCACPWRPSAVAQLIPGSAASACAAPTWHGTQG